MINPNFKTIAMLRDGGSRIVEFHGKVYFHDHAINSPTRNTWFVGKDRSGKKASDFMAARLNLIVSLELGA